MRSHFSPVTCKHCRVNRQANGYEYCPTCLQCPACLQTPSLSCAPISKTNQPGYCWTHGCKAAGCGNRHAWSGNCAAHQCGEDQCVGTTDWGHAYCGSHECTVEGCESSRAAQGTCAQHYSDPEMDDWFARYGNAG